MLVGAAEITKVVPLVMLETMAPFQLELPRIHTPNIGLLSVKSYKQAEQSIIKAYRRWVGDHPHRFIPGSQGTVEIRIKPDSSLSDSWATVFSSERLTCSIPLSET